MSPWPIDYQDKKVQPLNGLSFFLGGGQILHSWSCCIHHTVPTTLSQRWPYFIPVLVSRRRHTKLRLGILLVLCAFGWCTLLLPFRFPGCVLGRVSPVWTPVKLWCHGVPGPQKLLCRHPFLSLRHLWHHWVPLLMMLSSQHVLLESPTESCSLALLLVPSMRMKRLWHWSIFPRRSYVPRAMWIILIVPCVMGLRKHDQFTSTQHRAFFYMT